MFARLLAFSNGDLQALYDRSDGFYRRQLVLTTKEKQVDRADDPDLAEKMKAEAEGIFLWAFEGLQRLVANNFKLRRVTASVKIGKRSSVTTTISLISWNQRDISGAKRMRPSAPRISMKSTGCGARKTPLHR